MKQFFKGLWQAEDGQDLVEYALILGFIALAAVGTLQNVNTAITGLWNAVDLQLNQAAAS